MDKFEPIANSKAIVAGDKYRFTLLTSRLIRYEWSADGKFEDRASTFVVNRKVPVPDFQVLEKDDEIEILTQYFHLTYDKKRFSPNGMEVAFRGKVTLWGASWRYGQNSHNLGGTARTLDEVDGRCDMGAGILSKTGMAAVDDSASMLFDGKGFVTGRPPGDRIDGYLFCYGHDFKAAVKDFYLISGKQPTIPRWSLGNWWSRYYAYNDREYIDLMDTFKERKIPLTVAVIDMDWHLVNDERVPHAGWTGYTWNDTLFPDPKKFGKALHDRNLKITLNDHPHSGVHHHEDAYKDMAKALGHDTSSKAPILFDPTNQKFMEAFFDVLHRSVEKVACDFWWIDWQQGPYSKVEGVDPLWLLNHFHYVDNAKVSKHPLIFSRFAGPGSQRYPVGFSGDTVATWASLEFQPEFTATASNIGYGWWSHDIGGHYFGTRDDELVTRWVQFGVFSPIFRLHSSNSQWSSKEPWLYRKEHDMVMEDWMRLRHRLVPYLYTCNVNGSINGEPLVQPMYWSHSTKQGAWRVPNQYTFGDQLIAAPIVTRRDPRSNMAAVKVWLPEGRHVDIFTGTVYDGDREITMYRPLESIPVLAKEGAIIPLDLNLFPTNGAANPEAFEILVVVGQDGHYEIVEDVSDDLDLSHTDERSLKQRKHIISWTQKTGTLTAKILAKKACSFRFISLDDEFEKAIKVSVGGSKSENVAISTKYPDTPSVLVSVSELTQDESTIVIELSPDPQLSILDHTPRLRALLLDYQTEFSQKDLIWEAAGSKNLPITVRLSKLLGVGLDVELTGPFAEIMLADSRNINVQLL